MIAASLAPIPNADIQQTVIRTNILRIMSSIEQVRQYMPENQVIQLFAKKRNLTTWELHTLFSFSSDPHSNQEAKIQLTTVVNSPQPTKNNSPIPTHSAIPIVTYGNPTATYIPSPTISYPTPTSVPQKTSTPIPTSHPEPTTGKTALQSCADVGASCQGWRYCVDYGDGNNTNHRSKQFFHNASDCSGGTPQNGFNFCCGNSFSDWNALAGICNFNQVRCVEISVIDVKQVPFGSYQCPIQDPRYNVWCCPIGKKIEVDGYINVRGENVPIRYCK